MMNRIITIVCAIGMSLGVCAQNSSQARQILDRTAAKVNNKGGASADFTISSPKNGNMSGTIYIKGNKFHATTPDASIWYDGKTQWTYMKNSDEVNVSAPNESQQAQLNPYKFITLYKNGYDLSMKTVSGSYEVHLKSTKPNRAIGELYITINKKSYLPSKVRFLQKGQWSTITISNFKSKNLADSVFRFNAKDFPDAEVIDLR